jgi:hypothetical protein
MRCYAHYCGRCTDACRENIKIQLNGTKTMGQFDEVDILYDQRVV